MIEHGPLSLSLFRIPTFITQAKFIHIILLIRIIHTLIDCCQESFLLSAFLFHSILVDQNWFINLCCYLWLLMSVVIVDVSLFRCMHYIRSRRRWCIHLSHTQTNTQCVSVLSPHQKKNFHFYFCFNSIQIIIFFHQNTNNQNIQPNINNKNPSINHK